VIAYKVLRIDGTGVFTGFDWPPPSDVPGTWVDASVVPCRSGIHACRLDDLPLWLGRTLYEIELAGEIVEEPTKVIASRARLIRRIERWDDVHRNAYTRMCADRAHELAQGTTPALDNWEAVIEPSVPEGPALLGFVAARIAEEISGLGGFYSERRRQSRWLAEHLGLRG
jgi:hypothetical protein